MFRLVVIDDEYIVVEGIKAIIEREKLNCCVVGFAYDGIEALNVIKETVPDIVITDIRIPGRDGLSLIEEIREECPDTYFIVISGYTEFEYARRALTLGVKSYIDKPVTIAKVKEAIELITLDAIKRNKEKELVDYSNNLDQLMDQMINYLIGDEPKCFQDKFMDILQYIGLHSKDLKHFKSECYKVICVVLEVFSDNTNVRERELFISYSQLEEIASRDEILFYMHNVMNVIVGQIKANQLGSNHRIIKQLLAMLDKSYAKEIGLNELADQVDLNPAYLSILFKEEVGMSYVKYITKLRMDKAKDLLLEGKKVVEVSKLVGYSNYRYFCNIFKKSTGKTPNEYKGCIRKK